MKNEIELGTEVKCKVTGFAGIAISRIVYLNGCVQYSVQAKSKKGDAPIEIWIDEQQLTVLSKGILTEPKPVGGGFRSHPM